MGTTDPRLLINALGDLQEECALWVTEARESMESARNIQCRQEETVRLTRRRALVLKSEAEADQDSVESTIDYVEKLLDQCEDARHTATDLLQATQEVLQLAQQTLKCWEAELAKALQWLERALARLERAKVELAEAEWEFRAAESELENAVWALRKCRNDDNRRNCWSEQAAVQAARQRLESARYRLELAVEEVQAAQEEVRQAQARVACCRQAVAYAGKAVQVGGDAVTRAESSLVAAEKSLDDTLAAKRMTDKAKKTAEAEMRETEEMVIAAQQAEHFASEAEKSRRKADSANQSAQRLLSGSRLDLENRIQQLVKLNRPSPSIEYLRRKAVNDAWKQESALVKSGGTGTRNWKPREIHTLKKGKRIKGYDGHHIRSVNGHSPKWAKDPRNIEFVTPNEHLQRHGNHFRNITTGKLIDRQKMNALNRQAIRRSKMKRNHK